MANNDRNHNPYLSDNFLGRTGIVANIISEIPLLFLTKFDKKIRKFCDNTNLFENTDYGSWLGTPCRRYPKFSYKFVDNSIILIFYTDGFFKLDSLKSKLEEFFGLEVINSYFEPGKWVYELSNEPIHRLVITKNYLINNFYKNWDNHNIEISPSIIWNFDKSPHALIVGGTGAGKTYFFETLILQILTKKSKLYLIDPKRSDLWKLGKIIDSNCVAFDFDKTLTLIKAVQYEMDSRYISLDRGLLNNDYRNGYLPPIFLIFDEFAAFQSQLSSSQSKEINKLLMQLILKGRQAGIFILIGMQKPDATLLNTSIRDNLGMRISLGNMSSQGFVQIFGSSDGLSSQSCGQGYIYLSGLGWNIPRLIKAPSIDKNLDLNKFLPQLNHAHFTREISHTND